jgi:hypothetical protein
MIFGTTNEYICIFCNFCDRRQKTFGREFYLKSTIRNERTRRILITLNVYQISNGT